MFTLAALIKDSNMRRVVLDYSDRSYYEAQREKNYSRLQICYKL